MSEISVVYPTQAWQNYSLQRVLQAREQALAVMLQQRRELGWQVARQAAQILQQEFHAQRVWLFGSLVHGHWFTRWSDLDLAVMGLPPSHFYLAVSRLIDLSPEFKIDLVDLADCSLSLRHKIETQGVEL